MPVEKIYSKVKVGHLIVTLKTDKRHNELLDTEVYVGDMYLCKILASDEVAFLDEFRLLIQKYKIK